jgi:hypothetical protein
MRRFILFLSIGLFAGFGLLCVNPEDGLSSDSLANAASEAAEECPICAESLGQDNLSSPYPCEHRFHTDCINQWFNQPGGLFCPYCRAQIDLDSLLIGASAGGHLDVVDILLQVGANVNATDNDGFAALMFASAKGHLNVVDRLLAAGAGVNVASNNGTTALIGASYKGHLNIVNRLIAAGVNVNAASNGGYTALIGASVEGHLDIVNRLLASSDIDIGIFSKRGNTALDVARKKGHAEIVSAIEGHMQERGYSSRGRPIKRQKKG